MYYNNFFKSNKIYILAIKSLNNSDLSGPVCPASVSKEKNSNFRPSTVYRIKFQLLSTEVKVLCCLATFQPYHLPLLPLTSVSSNQTSSSWPNDSKCFPVPVSQHKEMSLLECPASPLLCKLFLQPYFKPFNSFKVPAGLSSGSPYLSLHDLLFSFHSTILKVEIIHYPYLVSFIFLVPNYIPGPPI